MDSKTQTLPTPRLKQFPEGWGRWFDGGGNGKIYGKEMNVARQSCEHFSSMGADLVEPTPWNPRRERKVRDWNIECLRVLLMLGVCLCHMLFLAAKHERFGVAEWISGLVSCSVDGFVFISGYYGIRFRLSKVIGLYAMALFCALECRLLLGGGGGI